MRFNYARLDVSEFAFFCKRRLFIFFKWQPDGDIGYNIIFARRLFMMNEVKLLAFDNVFVFRFVFFYKSPDFKMLFCWPNKRL